MKINYHAVHFTFLYHLSIKILFGVAGLLRHDNRGCWDRNRLECCPKGWPQQKSLYLSLSKRSPSLPVLTHPCPLLSPLSQSSFILSLQVPRLEPSNSLSHTFPECSDLIQLNRTYSTTSRGNIHHFSTL